LAALLNGAIDDAESDERPRDVIIDEMAAAAGIDRGTVLKILSGEINCPPIERLQGFSEVLDVTVEQQIAAAEEDGCEYDDAEQATSACVIRRNRAARGTSAAFPHGITRVLRAFASRPWFIEARKAEEIVGLLALRSEGLTDGFPATDPTQISSREGRIQVIRLHGVMMPRADMLSEISGVVSVQRFRAELRAAAADASIGAIVLDIDSPGGSVEFVPEAVADIKAARRADRPIIAVANSMACSAAYWIASAADELVVTPSGKVGSIGVYLLHEDISEAVKRDGVKMTFVFEGPRKIEGNPFEPLDDIALRALRSEVSHFYDLFTRDVAEARGAPLAAVRADPESAAAHFGGGRVVVATDAIRFGMADRIATIEETLQRVANPPRKRMRAGLARRRLALG
jgi:signal peptide peptidase SppA